MLDRALDFFDFDDFANRADIASHKYGSEETHLVRPYIDGVSEAANFDQCRQEQIDQTHGQIAMCDSAAERAILGAFFVDMDPLMVAGDFGKSVHPFLIDVQPVAGTEDGAFLADKIARAFINFGHVQALWLDTETISPVM